MLKLDGHGYSPTILHRIVHMAGVVSSFDVAATALQVIGEITISDRHINNLVEEIGQQLQQERDERTRQYVDQPLPRKPTEATSPVDLAASFLDGGRMRMRAEHQGPGVHEPHWRETKSSNRGWVRDVTIEVDQETKAVRRLVIQRLAPRGGFATVTFTLVDARLPDESQYRLEGHVSESDRLLTRDSRPDRRRVLLEKWIGPLAKGWIVDNRQASDQK